MRSLKTTGIIIKRSDFGEADRLLTFFAYDLGKTRALAKGSRKPLSKLGGHLEPPSQTQFQLTEGRNFYVITGAELVYPFADIGTSLAKTSVAYYFLEIVDLLTSEEESHPAVFTLLQQGLIHLETLEDEARLPILSVAFSLKMLAELGYLPELTHCVHCHKDLSPEGNAFSSQFGGLLCPECEKLDYGAIALSPSTIKALRLLLNEELTVVARVTVPPKTLHELERVMSGYLAQQTDRDLRSAAFVREATN